MNVEDDFKKKYDGKLKEFGFEYALTEDQGDEIAFHYEAKDYEDPEKWLVLLFRIDKETGKIDEMYSFHNVKREDFVKSNYIPSLNDLFDVLKASYEKGKGLSVKNFILMVRKWQK